MAVSIIQNYGDTESETGEEKWRGWEDHELNHATTTKRMEQVYGIKYVLNTTKPLTQDFLLFSR